ncbi:MAG TPA: cob(I)yrinic acid a,c-diamide adenosyltransferase [Pirellulales bacterium]|nr:cob(I)yrinic acid a,c-diamide adenosyltransferase [Pirellulales bacterium]
MNIYTKTGDDGTTGLFGGPRVPKNDARIEAYGTIDELNAVLGLVRAAGLPSTYHQAVTRVQNELFDLGAELASPDPIHMKTATIGPRQVALLEQDIDGWEEELPPLERFILPGGTGAGASLHFARTVCRRAERRLLTLMDSPAPVREAVLIYLNRLSDWLFVIARTVNYMAGCGDEFWEKSAEQ